MTDDDDLDLSAWDAPPAPANLADRVIDRMQAGAAIMAKVERTRSNRIRVISGVAFGVAAGALGLWLIRPSVPAQNAPVAMTPQPMSGGISVDKPSSIIVGDSRADLAAGARVVWVGNYVSQSSGVATWHVGKTETIAIDASDGVARIEATNANFRIEAKMNLTDVKIIGASATTAAAVALVTIVVYEGHVKVTGAAQQITINAGQGAEVAKDKPPVVIAPPIERADHTIAAAEPLTPIHIDAGESATIHEPDASRTLRVYVDRICGEAVPDHQIITVQPGPNRYTTTCVATGITHEGSLALVHDAGEKYGAVTTPPGPWGDDLDLTVKTAGRAYTTKANELTPDFDFHTAPDQYARVGDTIAVRLDARDGVQFLLVHPTADVATLTRDAKTIQAIMRAHRPEFLRCNPKSSVKLRLTIKPNGTVASSQTDSPNDPAGACIAKVGTIIMFPEAQDPTTITYPVAPRTSAEPTREQVMERYKELEDKAAPGCDPEPFVDQGTQAEAQGDHAGALRGYEHALACKQDPHTVQLGFMAACNGGNLKSARKFFKLLAPDAQQRLLTMCLRAHISEEELRK